MTPPTGAEISSHRPANPPEASGRDRRVAEALAVALPDSVNTRDTYIARWLSFAGWCDSTGLNPLPAAPDTVVRYLKTRGGSCFGLATLCLTASVITKVHEVRGHPSPCKDPTVANALRQLRFQLAKPRPEVGALTSQHCDMIALYANDPRNRGRGGKETPAYAAQRGRVDVALVYVLAEAGLRAAEASALTWGDVQRWDDGSGRITVPGSLAGAWTQAAIVAVTGKTMRALDDMRPSDAASEVTVFGLSASQIVRRVKAAAQAALIDNWEAFNGSSGRVGLVFRLAENGAPDHVIERQARRMQPNGIVGRYTSGECASEAVRFL